MEISPPAVASAVLLSYNSFYRLSSRGAVAVAKEYSWHEPFLFLRRGTSVDCGVPRTMTMMMMMMIMMMSLKHEAYYYY